MVHNMQLITHQLLKPHLLRPLQHKCTGGFVFIGNDAVQNGILNGTLQGTYLLARRKAESLHDFFTTDRRLEITDTGRVPPNPSASGVPTENY